MGPMVSISAVVEILSGWFGGTACIFVSVNRPLWMIPGCTVQHFLYFDWILMLSAVENVGSSNAYSRFVIANGWMKEWIHSFGSPIDAAASTN